MSKTKEKKDYISSEINKTKEETDVEKQKIDVESLDQKKMLDKPEDHKELSSNEISTNTLGVNQASGSGKRQELQAKLILGKKLMDDDDQATAKITTTILNAIKTNELKERAQGVSLVTVPLNVWKPSSPFRDVPVRKIVSGIPRIMVLKHVGLEVDDALIDHLLPQKGIPLIKNSVKMFTSGTDKVVYQIDSVNTHSQLSYNPESPPDSTLI